MLYKCIPQQNAYILTLQNGCCQDWPWSISFGIFSYINQSVRGIGLEAYEIGNNITLHKRWKVPSAISKALQAIGGAKLCERKFPFPSASASVAKSSKLSKKLAFNIFCSWPLTTLFWSRSALLSFFSVLNIARSSSTLCQPQKSKQPPHTVHHFPKRKRTRMTMKAKGERTTDEEKTEKKLLDLKQIHFCH